MKRLTYLIPFSVVALLMLASTAGAQAQEQGVEAVPVQEIRSVSIEDYYFNLADVGVEPGTTIMWINNGRHSHTVTSDDGQFDSGLLRPGDSFMVTFEGSGTLTYHCELHAPMVGSVTVVGNDEGGTVP